MKITDIRTLLMGGSGTPARPVPLKWTFVIVETDEGIRGVGESGLSNSEFSVAAAVNRFKSFIVGQDPTRVEHLWQQMFRHLFWRGGPVVTAALSAIDQALWDIAGKAIGLPVYKMLGGPVRDRIHAYTHADQEGTPAENAVRDRDAGFFGIKLGAGHPDGPITEAEIVDQMLDRLRSAREAAGPEMRLMTDFHGRLTTPQAIRFLREARPLDLFWAEELIPPDNPAAYADIAAAVPDVPSATGERLYLRWGFRDLIERRAVAFIQPDIGIAGGISELRRIASHAETHNIQFAPHNPLGPVATAATIHVAAATPNFAVLEHARRSPYFERALAKPLTLEDGHFELPTGPGLGIELDDEYVERFAYEMKPKDVYWHPDGSVADV